MCKIIKNVGIFKERLNQQVISSINNAKYEEALTLINILSNLNYMYNQNYCDDTLERSIYTISKRILGEKSEYHANEKTVLFYDGFGLNSRGLAQIYIKALCNHFKVIYITKASQKNSIPDIIDILERNQCVVEYLDDGKYVESIKKLNKVIEKYNPFTMFMYTMPDDVVVTTVFAHYDGVCMRFQVNLTDHAFWLGKNAFDICLEFRDYGASVSNQYRKIPKEKLLKLPFYPIIDINTEFEGFPFAFDEKKQKIIFSGGALYKTFSEDNLYYKIVDYILASHSNVVFWYAGTGDRTEMDKLISKYPQRIYLTNERSDLYQVIKKSTFYLSTYPVCGGLMFQYASVAGKVPITLKFDNISDGFLINQENLGIEFNTYNELKCEIDRILTDEEYLFNKEKIVEKAVIDEKDFEQQLINAINNKKTCFPISISNIDTSSLQKEYLARFNEKDLPLLLAKRRNMCLIKYYPLQILFGFIVKILKVKL